MFYIKSEIQKFRNDPLPQRFISRLMDAAYSIAFARAESIHMPAKKITTEALLINEVRYLNAYCGKDYSRKNILLALYSKNDDDLSNQVRLLKKCAEYAEYIRNTYKILPATDFLKINDALMNNDANILENHIDSISSVLVDDVWPILNNFYSPKSETPDLLSLALAWAELEDGFLCAKIHPFVKELLIAFSLRNTFEINHYSLFVMKQLITQKLNTEDIGKYSLDFLNIMTNAANDKNDLLIELTFCADKINSKLNSESPKLYSDNILNMLCNHLLLNNTMVAEILGVSTKTAISYLKQLEEIGLLKSERIDRELSYLNSFFVESIDKGG